MLGAEHRALLLLLVVDERDQVINCGGHLAIMSRRRLR